MIKGRKRCQDRKSHKRILMSREQREDRMQRSPQCQRKIWRMHPEQLLPLSFQNRKSETISSKFNLQRFSQEALHQVQISLNLGRVSMRSSQIGNSMKGWTSMIHWDRHLRSLSQGDHLKWEAIAKTYPTQKGLEVPQALSLLQGNMHLPHRIETTLADHLP